MNDHAADKDVAATTVPRGTDPGQLEATDFKARWAAFAGEHALPADHARQVPARFYYRFPRVADLRRLALEFFSWGAVHGVKHQRRIEELFSGR